MKNLTKKQKIIMSIVAIIIIAGIAVVAFMGFNFDLRFQTTNKLELYLGKDFEIADIKSITKEIMPNDVLMNFLDADTYAEKLNIVRGMKKHIDNKMVHDFAVCLDIVLDEKPLEEQIRDIENCLKTYVKYECSRLR